MVLLTEEGLNPKKKTARSGGGGKLRGNFGTGVRASFFKTYPNHILDLRKNDLFIYLIEQKISIFIYCSLILYTVSHFSYAPLFKGPHFFHKNAGIEHSR